jgi:hypothetical protein
MVAPQDTQRLLDGTGSLRTPQDGHIRDFGIVAARAILLRLGKGALWSKTRALSSAKRCANAILSDVHLSISNKR